jgi:hypothetical protein
MYIYIFVSSIFITALIAKTCIKLKPSTQDDFHEKLLMFSNVHYMKNVNLLSYFSEPENFVRLEKLLDKSNGIFEKTLKLLKNNEEIKKDYEITSEFFENIYPFEIEPEIKTPFLINDNIINSSLGQLNFFKWLLENDYLLHIE